MSYLYHVTTNTKAKRILKKGLEPGYTSSEFEPSIAEAERQMGIDRDDGDFWDEAGDFDTMPAEMAAREDFNEFLSRSSPRGKPTHNDAIFFWTSADQANMNASMMMNKPLNTETYVVLKVAKKDLPCKCYGASTEKAEDLFDDIMNHSGDWNPSPDEEDKERFWEKAEAYYEDMKVWEGQEDEDLEVLCSCPIPAKVIKRAI